MKPPILGGGRLVAAGAAVAWLACAGSHAATTDIGQVAGFHRISLSPGPNFIAAPLHRTAAFRGSVAAVTSGTVSFGGTPAWTTGQFGPRDGRAQFVAFLRKDASGSPGNEGDWWRVTSNTANSLTLETRGENLTTVLASGDEIEIRQLGSLRDLFGTGATLRLAKDSDGSASARDEDLVYLVAGTSFASEVFYHDGSLAPAGYYVDGNGPFDGSTLTVSPDEPIMVFRKAGAPVLNLWSAGQVHAGRLTHYLSHGANPVATGFPVDAPIAASGLVEAGWKADSDGSANAADEDLFYRVTGSAFSDEVFLHDGSVAPYGWYANGSPADDFPVESAKGFVVFVQNPSGLRWRETTPF